MTVIALPALDVTRLAADFSAAVRAALTDSQLLNVRRGDAVADDYTDTGELMRRAVHKQRPGADLEPYGSDIVTAVERAQSTGYQLSRILVACEFSGTVRDAMTARGHSAMSCDLLPSETPGEHHQGDVREILGDGFDMMIAHPPCQYLAASQLWRCQPKHDKDYPARQQKSDEALEFVRDLMAAPIPRQAIENPVSRIGTAIRPASQYVQPYEFGHDASKTTGLWLENLPKLVADPADYVEPRLIRYKGKLVKRWGNQSPCGADNKSPGPDRWKLRSKTFQGIADAMADQWGGIREALATDRPPVGEVAQLALF